MTRASRSFLFAHRISAGLFAMIIVVGGVLAAIPPEVAACVSSGGVTLSVDQALTNTRGTNCDFRGGGDRTGSGSYRIVPECYYSGSHSWGDPRQNNATGTPKYTNSVLLISAAAPGNTATPLWINGWETRLRSSNYTFGREANLQSLYMRNKRADLLAAALQIRRVGGTWRLQFQSPAARDDIIDGPHGPQINASGAPHFRNVVPAIGVDAGADSMGVYAIGLSHSGTAINALAYPWGQTPPLPNKPSGNSASADMFVRTFGVIGSRAGLSALQMMSDSPTRSMNALLWPSDSARSGTQYVDYRVEFARNTSWWSRWFPSRVWIETGVGTNAYTSTGYWTFVYRYNNGLYDLRQRWNVEVFFPNARPVYTRDEVIAGFKAVVRSQVNVQWNQAPTAVGGSSLRGSYYVPIAAAGPDCASDSFNILGLPLGAGPGNCNALGAVSDATATASADCRFFWNYRREEPPKLTAADFNNVMGQMYNRLEFRPNSAAAVVGEPVTFSLARAPRSRGIHILNRMSADSSITIEAYINQVGVTAYLGTSSTPVRIIPRATQAGTEYTFQYTFTQTPASRLQEPTCASTTSAAQLLSSCGIRFDSSGEPVYVLAFRTWWDGQYRYTGGGVASAYRGLFTEAHATMSAAVRAQTTPWVDSWGFNRNVFSASGGDISGPWPLYGRTSPDSYGTPMYRNADFTVNMPVLQVQPGRTE